ncbi:agmatinase [Shinella sp. SUS2]|uniref:agmatinase n=1 Tax=unclassified Shinella TaxID=2643062 RepID=UPI0006809DDA|nr:MULTISPECIES: agmatinase [unclassified Shinella]KNY17986.1 agmatinase [Shinella sp. SUS2]KOC75621.1 agmatinase [Shinella sp. GWS1]
MLDKSDFQPVDAAVTPRFSDVATFLRTRRHDIVCGIDIGLCGVPFDLGLNYRSGPRQGPAGVREASRIIRRIHPVTGVRPYDLCTVADIGDAPINPLNKDASIDQIQAYFQEVKDAGIRPIAIGGDHTIPTPILRALASDRPVGILHIDAHADVMDTMCGTKVNHATFMRRAYEENLIDPRRVVQLGLRGSRFGDDDVQFGYDKGYSIITLDEYEEMGRAAVIEKINSVLGDGPFYISLDIDSIDPAYAPGTAVPEIGGLLPRDLQVIIRSLQGKDLVGADISEVAPVYDPTGITCVTAANMMFEMLCVMAKAVEKAR